MKKFGKKALSMLLVALMVVSIFPMTKIEAEAADYRVENAVTWAINIANNDKYGYLTQCPTNVGTGMRASVMVHLPALTATGNINKILDVVNGFGMNIRGLYGEGSDTQGNM